MEIVAKTIKEVIQYANLDKGRFAEEIQSHIEDKQAVDFTEQRKRMTVCEKRTGELEMLIAQIYEDNALGKLSDTRYIMLYNQYEGEQEQLQEELDSYKAEQTQYENDRKSAARFLKLVERYSNAEEMATLMLNGIPQSQYPIINGQKSKNSYFHKRHYVYIHYLADISINPYTSIFRYTIGGGQRL